MHDRDPNALLVNLGGGGAVHAAAHVGRVAAGREVADDAVFEEHRREHGHIVDLTGGEPGVVGDQDIARRQRGGRDGLQEMTHAGGHGVDVAGSAGERLGDHVAAGVEDPAGQVLGLADHRREGGAHERDLLLVDDRKQPVPEHFQSEDVHQRATRFHCSSMTQ